MKIGEKKMKETSFDIMKENLTKMRMIKIYFQSNKFKKEIQSQKKVSFA